MVFKEVINVWDSRVKIIKLFADQIHHWCYYTGYKEIIDIIDREAVAKITELHRAPMLAAHFLDYLRRNMTYHVSPDHKRVIDEEAMGSFMTLQMWQRSGYQHPKVPRTPKNHEKRLEIWRSLYSEGLVVATSSGPVTVTYEGVIKERQRYAEATYTVPYWMLWNYGHDHYGLRGFPEFQGLMFLEKGHKAKEAALVKAKRDFVKFITSYFFTGKGVIPRSLRSKEWKEVYRDYRPGVPIVSEMK